MSNVMSADAKRVATYGKRVAAKVQTITGTGAATYQLFTVTGGNVLITAMWGVTTVALAGANTVNVQIDPTDGDTVVVVTAADLGTADTAVGTLLGVLPQNAGAYTISKGGLAIIDLPVPIGEVESVVTEVTADGGIQWYCTWLPLDDGAVLTASA